MDTKKKESGLLPQDGFQRLVDYIKREHNRLRRVQEPETKARYQKIRKYKDQQEIKTTQEMKKGLQLKTAA